MKRIKDLVFLFALLWGVCECYDITSIRISTYAYKIRISSTISTSGYSVAVRIIPENPSVSTGEQEKSDQNEKFNIVFEGVQGKYRVEVKLSATSNRENILFAIPYEVTVNQNLPPPPTELRIIQSSLSAIYLDWKSDPGTEIWRYTLCYYAKRIEDMVCVRISGKLNTYYPLGLTIGEAYTFFIAQETEAGTSHFIGKIRSKRITKNNLLDDFKDQLSLQTDTKSNSLFITWTPPTTFSIVESNFLIQSYDTKLATHVLNYCNEVYKMERFEIFSKDKNLRLNSSVIERFCGGKDLRNTTRYFANHQVKVHLNIYSLDTKKTYRLVMINLLNNGMIHNESVIISTKYLDCHYDCWYIKSHEKIYLGNQFMTEDGIECQNWNSQYPYTFSKQLRPGAENFCRMPIDDPEERPWCYTMSESVRWDHCDVQQCSRIKYENICPLKFEVTAEGDLLKIAWSTSRSVNSLNFPNFYVIEIIEDNTKRCVDLVEYTCPTCKPHPLSGMFNKIFKKKIANCANLRRGKTFTKSKNVHTYLHKMVSGPGTTYIVTIHISNNRATGIKVFHTETITIPFEMSGPPTGVTVFDNKDSKPQVIWSPPSIKLSDQIGYLIRTTDDKGECQGAYHWSCKDCVVKNVARDYSYLYTRNKREFIAGCPRYNEEYFNSNRVFRQTLMHINASNYFEIRILPISSIGFGKEILIKKGEETTKKSEKKPSSSGTSGAWIGVIVFLLILCFAAGFIYIRYFHKSRLAKLDFRASLKRVEINSTSDSTPGDIVKEPQAISVNALHRRLERMKRENRLIEEFKLLNEMSQTRENTLNLKTTTALSEENVGKNRYKSMVPFDHNRVKLPTPKRISERNEANNPADYINASFITGFSGGKDYIAAQGPLETTIRDFWEMVWGYEINIIVILTRTETDRKFKCDAYWPDLKETKEFILNDGASMLKVTSVQQNHSETFVVREFELSTESLTRKVTQMHLLTWDDHGVPNSGDFFTFWKRVDELQTNQNHSAPLLVHCSAGVGRTGSFIAIDYVMQSLKSGNSLVDIFHTILKMREERRKFVQKDIQYQFIHEFIVYLNEKEEISNLIKSSQTSRMKTTEINIAYGALEDDVFDTIELETPEPPPPPLPSRPGKTIREEYTDAVQVSPAHNCYEKLSESNNEKKDSLPNEEDNYDSLWNREN